MMPRAAPTRFLGRLCHLPPQFSFVRRVEGPPDQRPPSILLPPSLSPFGKSLLSAHCVPGLVPSTGTQELMMQRQRPFTPLEPSPHTVVPSMALLAVCFSHALGCPPPAQKSTSLQLRPCPCLFPRPPSLLLLALAKAISRAGLLFQYLQHFAELFLPSLEHPLSASLLIQILLLFQIPASNPGFSAISSPVPWMPLSADPCV